MFKVLEDPRHPIFLFVLCCLLSGNIYFYLQSRNQGRVSNDQGISAADWKETFSKNEALALSYIGKMLQFPESLELVNKESFPDKPTIDQPKLLLIFSELSCNVCMDDETQFGNHMAELLGPNQVIAVVQSNNKRFCVNYVRMNQTKFPVYFDKDGAFIRANKIHHTPLLLAVSPPSEITYSHQPITGQTDLCPPHHEVFQRLIK